MADVETTVSHPRPMRSEPIAQEPPEFNHPVLRLLAHESATDTTLELWLRQAISPVVAVQRRVDSLMEFAKASLSGTTGVARLIDPDGIVRELLDLLEPLSVDPRLVEERIRLNTAPPTAPAAAATRKRTQSPCYAGRWVKRFAASNELAMTLESGQPAWRADQCAAALRLMRQGLLETDVFSTAAALDIFSSWVQPFWALVLDELGESIRMQYPADYQAMYGPHAQRLLWERLKGVQPDFSADVASRDGLGHVVVTSEIPPSQDNVDKAQIATYQRLRAPLTLVELPSVERIHAIAERLSSEFPWALKPIGAIVRKALARRLLGAREMGGLALLLVGPPGCGKSRLARRLAEEFGFGFLPLPLGGQGDHKILTGTSRGWAGGQPSPVITAMLTMAIANPLVLADEVDKASAAQDSTQGPSLNALLLGMTERENSRHWRDLFLQATCDISKIMWLATANDTKRLSRAFLDRFRCIEVDAPGRDHMVQALPYVGADIEEEWGLPAGTLPPLPASLISSQVESMRDVRLLAETYVQDWTIEHASASKH